MLLQSHNGTINLLPALPEAWPEGHIKGLKARGGFIVDMWWSDGKLIKANISSENGGKAKIRYNNDEMVVDIKPGKTYNYEL